MRLRQLKRLHSGEQGMALIVSLMVAFVILMLSSVVVAQSLHSLNASGYDRQRLTSYNAAEAGANAWWEDLQTTALSSLNCSTKAGVMNTQPNEAQYSASATFYRADRTTTMTCSEMSNADPPAYVRIVSTGSSEGEAARQVETFAKLTPIYTGFGAAIMSVNGTSFGNNFEVFGDSGNDGDIYVLNGDLTISQSPVIWGSVYVPNGALSMFNSSEIKGNIWSKASASLTTVGGWAKSTTGNISGGSVGADATAAGTITSSVLGTKYPGTNPGPVPTQTFPQIFNSTTAWTNAGYTLVGPFAGLGNTPCQDAYNYIHNTGTGTWESSGLTNIVIQINATCTFQNVNNDVNTIRGNLAVITDGGFAFNNQSNWNASGTVKNAYFISGYTSTTPCPSSKDIRVDNNTNFNSFVNVFFYTPCSTTLANQNNFIGQALSGTALIANKFTMTYKAVLVPGQGTVSGFSQDIAYVREI